MAGGDYKSEMMNGLREEIKDNVAKILSDVNVFIESRYISEISRLLQEEGIDDSQNIARSLLFPKPGTKPTVVAKWFGTDRKEIFQKRLKEIKHLAPSQHLAIIIPDTEKMREEASKDDSYDDGYNGEKPFLVTEEMNVKENKMAFERYLNKKLEKFTELDISTDDQNALMWVVRRKDDIYQVIEDFLKACHQKCKRADIVLIAHGTESGEIALWDELLPTNDFLLKLSQLANKYIPIVAVLEQCYSHVYDKGYVGLNLTVYPTTKPEKRFNVNHTIVEYDVTYDKNKDIYFSQDVTDARDQGLDRNATDYPLTPPVMPPTWNKDSPASPKTRMEGMRGEEMDTQ